MKRLSSPDRPLGFTLMELMAVIAIIVLLAGILIAALPGIQNRLNREKVESFLAELEGGLSKYEVDNGIYPQNPVGGDREGSGLLGATVLYKHLSGDWDEDGKVDTTEEVYVDRLDYDSNQSSRSPRSTSYQGAYAVIDSYNSPVRYLAEAPNLKPADRQTYNPTYDIWSIVDTNPANSDDFSTQSRYITNWQAK